MIVPRYQKRLRCLPRRGCHQVRREPVHLLASVAARTHSSVDNGDAYLRRIAPVALLSTLDGDERVECAWDGENCDDDDGNEMSAEKGKDVKRVVANGDEGRVGEREDDGEHRGREVT